MMTMTRRRRQACRAGARGRHGEDVGDSGAVGWNGRGERVSEAVVRRCDALLATAFSVEAAKGTNGTKGTYGTKGTKGPKGVSWGRRWGRRLEPVGVALAFLGFWVAATWLGLRWVDDGAPRPAAMEGRGR